MKKIGLIGYGEFGVQIEKLILQQFRKKPDIHYFDDILYGRKTKNSHRFGDYMLGVYSGLDFYVCLGYKHAAKKKKIINELLAGGRRLPAYIHRTAYINPTAKVEAGAVIYPMSNVDKNSVIGKGALLNNSVVVSHDNNIGACSYLSPGTVTSGFVTIGEGSFIGSGAVISNGIKTGNNCIVGIGAVVTKNIPAGRSAIGNPLKILKNKLKIE
ncbi:MAG: hypothetical protein IT281_07150 [Ignavibacteria bacterium]|nr:hypothetical protein [Ignavibacteria bacterium]MCC7159298.1 hypothetical protein [Ignavibacteria bacterium]